MLDSDNLPLRNPEYLFESREYLSSGSLFFSDWWDILEWVKPEAYTAFGLQFPGYGGATLAAESGQLLLNRSAVQQAPSQIVLVGYPGAQYAQGWGQGSTSPEDPLQGLDFC